MNTSKHSFRHFSSRFFAGYLLMQLCIFSFPSKIFSQDCNCKVEQVENNTVQACDLVIGDIKEVNTTAELRSAISTANNAGGNMTILIGDGTYPIASTASFPYITGDNIVFRSLSGQRDAVTITGQGMMATGSTEDGFLIAGNNVTIADLTIRDVGNHGIQVSGHNLFVHNVRIQDTYEQMLKGSTTADSIDDAIVQCSLFEYTAGIGPNWYIGGLDIHKGNGWIVRDNVFKDISSPHTAVAEHAIHFWQDSRDNVIERNVIYNCDRGIGFGLGNNPPQNDGGIIKNNIIFNDGAGLYNDVGIGLESSPNTEVYNNTIYVDYPNAVEYRFQSTTGVEIKNNLCNKSITSRNGGTANIETNYTLANESWFVDTNNGNLRLAASHPDIVDGGSDLQSVVTTDLDQNARPVGQGYDIGAHEWQTISSNNNINKYNIQLSPNPASNLITLMLDDEIHNAIAQVCDIKGRVLKNISLKHKASTTINISDLSPGIYVVLLTQDDKTITKKILIKN